MITRDNITEVIKSIDLKDKKRILNCNKEYTVLILHVFNAGSYVSVITTNNYIKYQYVSKNGNCILETNEVIDIINS